MKRYGVILIVLAAMTGCADNKTYFEQTHAKRAEAYSSWQRVHRRQEQTETVLSGQLNLMDAVKLSLAYNKSLQTALQSKEVARGHVVESYSEVLPHVTSTSIYKRLDEVSSFTIPAVPPNAAKSVSMGELNNYSSNLQIRQPLYRGGAMSAALRVAQQFQFYTDEQVRAQVQQTIYDVAQAYFDTLLAQQLYEVNADAVKSGEAHLAEVKLKQVQGVSSAYDVLRAEVDVSNFRAVAIQQQNKAHLGKARLLQTMGVSQDSEVELSDIMAYEAYKPVMEDVVKTAFENRPDLYSAEVSVRMQEEALTIVKSEYWPKVDAYFNQGWARPDPHNSSLDNWGDAWQGWLTMEWPLFDGLGREGRIIQERAKLRQQKIALQDTQEQALLQIQQTVLSLRDAEELVDSQKLNLDRAAEGLRLVEVGYREGVNTEVEVIDARSSLTVARGLYYQAIYAHTTARLILQRVMGILGPRAGDEKTPKESPVQPGHIEESIKN
jgi:outer membrane protein